MRVLLNEPSNAARRTLERMLLCLEYEPVAVRMPSAEQFAGAHVLIIEPRAPGGVLLAQAANAATPCLPLVCLSSLAPAPELAELGIRFDAVLVKPYTGHQLDDAIKRSLVRHPGRVSPRDGYRAA
jgi:hypothetical protein